MFNFERHAVDVHTERKWTYDHIYKERGNATKSKKHFAIFSLLFPFCLSTYLAHCMALLNRLELSSL